MASDNDVRQKAIENVRELLSKETLNTHDVELLQGNLNTLGHTNTGVDGDFGPRTARDAIGFLANRNQREFIPEISSRVWRELHDHEFGPEIKGLMTEQLDLLITQDSALSQDQLKNLQRALEYSMEADQGKIDGRIGPMATALIERRLVQDPTLVPEMNGGLIIAFENVEKLDHLERFIKQDMDSRMDRAQALLDLENAVMNTKNGVLSEDVARAQFLMHTLGYDPGKVDGRTGTNTQNAFKRFTDDNPGLDILRNRRQMMTENIDSVTTPRTTTPVAAPRTAPKVEMATQRREIVAEHNGATAHPARIEQTGVATYGIPADAYEAAWERTLGTNSGASASAGFGYGNARPLIVIDLGHGADIGANGKVDPGAVMNYNIKKDGTLEPIGDDSSGDGYVDEVTVVDAVGPALAEQLSAMGYQVALTRGPGEDLRYAGDKGKTLSTRADLAENLSDIGETNGVIFISLHANNSANARATGDFTHVQPNANNPDSKALGTEIARNFHIGKGPSTADMRDDQNLGVLRAFERAHSGDSQLHAATLVELGNFTHPDDLRELVNMTHDPSQAAENIAGSIDSFVRERVNLNSTSTLAVGVDAKIEPPRT